MRSILLFTAVAASQAIAAEPDYLPFNHEGPGYIACRSFISISGKGDVPHWSDTFPTSATAYSVKPPFEAYIKEKFSALGNIYSATCFKFSSPEQAERMINSAMYGKVAVRTRWRP